MIACHSVRRRVASHLAIAAAAIGTLVVAVPEAQAADDIIAPGTRPMWAALALGPAIGVVNAPGFTQFKLEEEFGYHFSGDSSGPALGVNIGESFGGGGVVFQPGMKFWWDIQIVDDMAIYISPNAKVGYGGFFGGGAAGHSFNWEIAAEGKVILGDRGLLFFRPFALDFFAGNGFLMRYDLMFGGGVTF
ncbi:MAG: hypothetical protein R3B72_25085 [Polyangiaceae bacterium]